MRVKKCLAIFSLMMIMCLSVLPSFVSAEQFKVLKEFNDITVKNGDETFSFTFDSAIEGKHVFHKFYVDFPSGTDLSNVHLQISKGPNKTWVGTYTLKSYLNDKTSGEFTIETMGKSYDCIDIINRSGKTITAKKLIVYYPDGAEGFETFDNISNLNTYEGIDNVNFSWINPTNTKFTGVSIYKNDELLKTVDKSVSSYKVEGLEANENYNFKFVALYGDKKSTGVQKGVKTLIDPKTVPPGQVSSLMAEPTYQTVKLKWKRPKDDDLAGFKILQNGKQIAEIGLEEEFTVKNLKQLTDYTFSVISVDKDKNDSPPVSLSVKTLEEKDDVPPHVPSNVIVKPSNGALISSWDKVSDEDLAGYNVYVDGKKINNNLITSTTFVIKDLENGKKYKIQVQAVDRSKNASELSLSAFGIPDVNAIPVVENDYSVKNVSDGVGTMFSQLWLALAFVVGISLAFYVIYKLKQTILS